MIGETQNHEQTESIEYNSGLHQLHPVLHYTSNWERLQANSLSTVSRSNGQGCEVTNYKYSRYSN